MTERRLAAVLWPLLVAYGGWLLWHAATEITAEQDVASLHRTYAYPYDVAYGRVIDVRPADLLTELRDRYAVGQPLPARPAEDTPAAWAESARALGLDVHEARGPGRGLSPRLVFPPGGPDGAVWLITGFYGHGPIAFVPPRGAVLLAPGAVPDETPALELRGAREPPW